MRNENHVWIYEAVGEKWKVVYIWTLYVQISKRYQGIPSVQNRKKFFHAGWYMQSTHISFGIITVCPWSNENGHFVLGDIYEKFRVMGIFKHVFVRQVKGTIHIWEMVLDYSVKLGEVSL